jgi:hypothetical protein
MLIAALATAFKEIAEADQVRLKIIVRVLKNIGY